MKNRRIQTTMVGTSFGDSVNMEDGKYEIIHKDIGYSSDADMSDSCEVIDGIHHLVLLCFIFNQFAFLKRSAVFVCECVYVYLYVYVSEQVSVGVSRLSNQFGTSF